MDYESMLERAYEKMPPVVFEKKRFEVPKLKVSIEKNKTVIKNFKEVADYIRRDPKHLLKFLGKEIGAAWRIEGSRAVFVGKFGQIILEKKLKKYLKLWRKPFLSLRTIDQDRL